MNPISNKVNIPILIVAAGLLAYFHIDLATVLIGGAVISGPIYPLYITIGILVFLIVSIAILIILRAKWESNKVNTGRFL
jgi:hypothetical protein